LFTQSSPVRELLLQAFPFLSTGKGDTASAFSGLHVYLQFTWEVGLPPSPVEFSSLCHSHKFSRSWLLWAPTLSGHAQLVYLQFQEGFPFPTSSAHRAPHPLCYVSFLFLLLITQFLFFPWVGVGLCRGYTALAQGCLWENHGTA
jgi:hypothetical protein